MREINDEPTIKEKMDNFIVAVIFVFVFAFIVNEMNDFQEMVYNDPEINQNTMEIK